MIIYRLPTCCTSYINQCFTFTSYSFTLNTDTFSAQLRSHHNFSKFLKKQPNQPLLKQLICANHDHRKKKGIKKQISELFHFSSKFFHEIRYSPLSITASGLRGLALFPSPTTPVSAPPNQPLPFPALQSY